MSYKPDETGLLSGQSQVQSTFQKSRAISNIVGQRLKPGATAPSGNPLPYSPVPETDDPAAQAIAGGSITTATNGEAAEAAAMNWNAWLDSSFVYTDRNHPVAGYDGPMFVASVGLDRTVGEASVIGVLLNTEYVDFETVGGKLKSRSFGIGAYAGSAITDKIVADAMVIWNWGENDTTLGVASGDFDSRRLQAAANLTGYWYRDAWRYSPTVGLTFSREEQDSYFNGFVFTPSRTLDSAVAIAGMHIGHTTFLDDTRTVEPWVGVNAEWEFHTSGLSGSPGAELDPFDVRILGGLNAQISPAVSASLKADVAGIARSDYLVGTFGGQLAVRF